MKPISNPVASFWSDAGWCLQNLDVLAGQAVLMHLSQQDYQRSIFLDQRVVSSSGQRHLVDLDPLVDASPVESRPACFVFHIGHCGSTLLTRVLQDACRVLPLREPVPLRTLAGLVRQQGNKVGLLDPKRLPDLQWAVLAALSRRMHPDMRSLVKATSICNNLMGRVLAHHRENRAVFLYLTLESFLATMLRSEARQREIRNMAPMHLTDLQETIGDDGTRLYQLSIGETVALNWTRNMLWRCELSRGQQERVMPVDFEHLLQDPMLNIARLCRFLELEAPRDRLEMAWSQVAGSHAKDPGTRYSPRARQRELDLCRREQDREIRRGLRWVREQLKRHSTLAQLEPLLENAGDGRMSQTG